MTDKKISAKKTSAKKPAPKSLATNEKKPNADKSAKSAKSTTKSVKTTKTPATKFTPPPPDKVAAIKSALLAHFPAPTTELHFASPYELLVAVMLSAQCTDRRVNLITPALFAAYPTPRALAAAKPAHVKALIASCSFYNNKAENLVKMARAVCENYGGEVPLEAGALVGLAGVGQKSANVVLIEWCGANLMAVDTHVFRVAHRLGLARASTPAACEAQLSALFQTRLNHLHQALVLFGRYTCRAVKPACEGCFLREFCVVAGGKSAEKSAQKSGGAGEKSNLNGANSNLDGAAAEIIAQNSARNSAKISRKTAQNLAQNLAQNSPNPPQNSPQNQPKSPAKKG